MNNDNKPMYVFNADWSEASADAKVIAGALCHLAKYIDSLREELEFIAGYITDVAKVQAGIEVDL